MEIRITGNPNEIADLVVALQERQGENDMNLEKIAGKVADQLGARAATSVCRTTTTRG